MLPLTMNSKNFEVKSESNLNSRNVEEMHNCIVKFFNEFLNLAIF